MPGVALAPCIYFFDLRRKCYFLVRFFLLILSNQLNPSTMKRILPVVFLLSLTTTGFAQKDKDNIIRSIDQKEDLYSKTAMDIWSYAEVGYQEYKSSEALQKVLADAGFKVESGVAGIPTAFTASFGNGKPVIAILGEFDALPGLSQAAVPEKSPIEGGIAGHACGHHLFGVASAAAAISLKDWLASSKTSGTIRFYGTPAEEGGSGKVYMVREGLFNDVDAVINWHPASVNSASPGTSLANKTGKFRFYGIASHAAAAPERGRSALDAVEAMDMMVNMMREHIKEDARIHYVITNGGTAPNVVPDFAEAYYYVRHKDNDEVKDMWNRLENAAKGAALGTDTKVEIEVTGGVYSLLPNETLAKIMQTNLEKVGGYTYTAEEKAFAEKLSTTLGKSAMSLDYTQKIIPYEMRAGSASTDVGDVSWNVPTVGLAAATWVPGTAAHSWQAVASGGTSIGVKGMMVAAKAMAITGYDLFKSPKVLEQAKAEFNAKRGTDFVYDPLLGNRPPALDYRK